MLIVTASVLEALLARREPVLLCVVFVDALLYGLLLRADLDPLRLFLGIEEWRRDHAAAPLRPHFISVGGLPTFDIVHSAQEVVIRIRLYHQRLPVEEGSPHVVLVGFL